MIIHAFISSRLDYCNSLFICLNRKDLCRLQTVQNSAARLLTHTSKRAHITPILASLHWLPVKFRMHFKILVLTFRALQGQAPPYISDLIQLRTSSRSLRSTGQRFLVAPHTHFKTRGDRSFQVVAPRLWNALPPSIRCLDCYSMMIGELDTASGFLHKAVHLAHQMHNNDAIIYKYSLHVTLFVVFLLQAEKLFKAAMSFILSGGTPQDDNAVIVMSLKLASIYATQNKNELAEHGFQFCTESLKAKIEKQKEFPPESLSDEERKDTRLLLGLSLDTRVRYLAANHRFTGACRDYQHALQTCQEEQGESHPQSLVLMSDLATVLDLQGKHDEALAHVKKAVELGQAAGHPDQHFEESGKLYQEALALARTAGDGEAIEQLQEGLKELASRRDGQTESKQEQELKE
uniref:Tetratricopeptide repeat domain 19 n=1 Tax=Cyprinus carpio carpio TaxID=630221 RepID=A0A8C1I461_CYPCA